MIVAEWLREAEGRLRAAKVPYPSRDALLLVAHVTGRDKAIVLAHPETPLKEEEEGRLAALLARRESREPLSYIRGHHEFWGQRILVGPGCLIPRPETEHLVEEASRALRGIPAPRVADVGTGSGCLLAALAREMPGARLIGIECEDEALVWARLNTAGLASVRLLKGNLADPPCLSGLDAIVSNPPYVTAQEWPDLPPEVRLFEPEAALRCDEPLGPYRALALWAVGALKDGGRLLCEIGIAQARRAAALRRIHPRLAWVGGVRDLAGRLRVAAWRKG